ncbi:unnamed protein product [Lampetra planeri]
MRLSSSSSPSSSSSSSSRSGGASHLAASSTRGAAGPARPRRREGHPARRGMWRCRAPRHHHPRQHRSLARSPPLPARPSRSLAAAPAAD